MDFMKIAFITGINSQGRAYFAEFFLCILRPVDIRF